MSQVLVSKVAQKTGFSQSNVREFISAFKEAVREEVEKGGSITLREFGTFKTKHVQRSGEIKVQGTVRQYSTDYKTIKFSPSKTAKW